MSNENAKLYTMEYQRTKWRVLALEHRPEAEIRRNREFARVVDALDVALSQVKALTEERDELLAALAIARELGMSIEPMQGDGLVWAMKNERAQHAEAEADAYRSRVEVEERARLEVEAALRSTTTRAEKADARASAAEARAERLAGALRELSEKILNKRTPHYQGGGTAIEAKNAAYETAAYMVRAALTEEAEKPK